MATSPAHKRARHRGPPKHDTITVAVPVPSPRPTNRARVVLHFRYRPNDGVARWKPEEAFRELIRRWREDIIRINGISEDDFAVLPSTELNCDDELEICYRVPLLGSEPKKYLGHIRYVATKGAGHVEIVTKGLRLDLSGNEGDVRGIVEAKIPYESLETAILAFMMTPQNHGFSVRSGWLDWRFNFNKYGLLVATQHPIPEEDINDILQAIGDSDGMENGSSESVPPNDTQFIFGELGRGADDHGNSTRRARVKEEDFRNWAKTALFLWNLDSSKPITTKGDIILDGRFSGLLYYDGFLLRRQDAAEGGKRPLKYGYNFPAGSKLIKAGTKLSADDQAKAIIAIWNMVLIVRPMLAAELSNMLNNTTTDFGDVVGAETYLAYDSAKLLRMHLLGDSPNKLWYFSAEEKAKNPNLDETIKRMGREGRELTRRYWSVMSKHGLLHTAEVELQKRPRTDSIVSDIEVAASSFGAEVRRLSQACIKLCGLVKDYRLSFLRGDDAGTGVEPGLAFDHESKVVEIPEQWLSKDRLLDDLDVPLYWDKADMEFHAVYTLFTELLNILPDDRLEPRLPASIVKRMKKALLSEIHFRLLAHNKARSQIRLQNSQGDTTSLLMSGTALTDTGWARPGDVIQFQVHRQDCSHVSIESANGDDLGLRDPSLASFRQHNGDDSADAPVSRTCQSIELVCPASPASYIYAIFEELRPRRRYYAMAYNKSDPASIGVALEGHWFPDRLSAAEQREAELANGRHFIGAYQCYIAGAYPAEVDAGGHQSIPMLGSQDWAGMGTFMMP